MSTLVHSALLRLRRLPLVSAFLLDGRALGGGAELALAADLRLWAPWAKLAFVQARMGVATGWGGGCRLVELMGQSNVRGFIFFDFFQMQAAFQLFNLLFQALKLLLSSRSVGLEEASSLGLCDHALVCDSSGSSPEKEAVNYLSGLVGALEPEVVRAAKRICLNGARTETMPEDRLREERNIFAPLWGGAAQKRALQEKPKH